MVISSIKEQNIRHFKLCGTVNSHNVEPIKNEFDKWIQIGETYFVGDLSELDYISSSGLRALLFAAKMLVGKKGGIVFHSMKDSVRDVFRLTGLIDIIQIAENKEEALKKLL